MQVSFHYGADAVYIGGKAFNLRAKSANFANAEIEEALAYAHGMGRKLYVALNILAHNREIKALPKFVRFLDQLGVDAVIVADLGILDLVREESNLPIHISTQASSTNWRSVKMYQKLGAKRIVLAREVSIDEIKSIKDHAPDVELEVFVHGAMCMTYSGRCNLSRYFSARDGNRGVCTNSCRWKYHLVEEKRPGEYMPVYEDDTGTYIYNSKDLCTIDFIDQLLDAGVDGLKIEGRMKSHLYCATTTKVYREALDSYLDGKYSYNPEWRTELERIHHRGYTSGFYHGKLDSQSEQLEGKTHCQHRFAGIVKERLDEDSYLVEIREKFDPQATLELLKPKQRNQFIKVTSMVDRRSGSPISMAQPNMLVKARFSHPVEVHEVFATEQAADDARSQ